MPRGKETIMKRLYVLYDGACGVCCRAVARLAWEPAYIELRFAPAGSMAAQAKFAEAMNRLMGSVAQLAQGPKGVPPSEAPFG